MRVGAKDELKEPKHNKVTRWIKSKALEKAPT